MIDKLLSTEKMIDQSFVLVLLKKTLLTFVNEVRGKVLVNNFSDKINFNADAVFRKQFVF